MRKIILFILVLTIGCSGVYKNNVNFNPLEPIRVAVLPFAFMDSNGSFIDPDKSLLIDQVGLLSSELKDPPQEFVRKLVQTELSKTRLDKVAPAFVDAQLSHHGFANKEKLNVEKVFKASPSELCNELLQCDAVLYGKLLQWDRSYYAIQSEADVELELKLVSRDGKVLFTSLAKDSDGRGITKGPTGFSDLVTQPIAGLSNNVIIELARKVVKKAVQPLQSDSQPEFVQTAPPAIFASAHDATSGSLFHSKPLNVVMLGTSKSLALFSIGQAIKNVPMIERDDGHYFGQYYPLPSDSFRDQPVSVTLIDKYGRSSTQQLGRVNVTLN